MNEHRVEVETSAAWARKWATPEYIAKRKGDFEALDAYLNKPIGRLLDIGCGFAWQSRFFAEKYNTELWLLDGDSSTNDKKADTASFGNWNQGGDGLLFYHSLDYLDQELKRLGTTNYHLVDANNINIPEDVKFDVITSWLSCGHHYPVSVYRDLMLKHSHKDTRIILDIRRKGHAKTPIGVDGFEIVDVVVDGGKKRCTAEIKLI
jgi:SAM-dependent methyltransferase